MSVFLHCFYCKLNDNWFLADRTNGRTYATVLRLSSSVTLCIAALYADSLRTCDTRHYFPVFFVYFSINKKLVCDY